MLLLRDLVEGSLDEGYARAAARREADGRRPSRSGLLVLTAGLVAVGLLLTTAYVQTRSRAGAADEARDALVAEVRSGVSDTNRVRKQLDRLRADVTQAQRDALQLTGEGSDLAERLSRLEVATGAGPVVGPGMVVQLNDAPSDSQGADVDPRTDAADEGRVTDRDLQTIVNEVWAAGAEAIAVNGQRLTALSAIRSAGEAVLVDFRPLSPPYQVTAIGDPGTLRETFVAGFGGSYLEVLKTYGISYDVDDRDRVRLPASAGMNLRYAVSPGGETAGGRREPGASRNRSTTGPRRNAGS
jgi:uncharacterized protein YlxW (UPF0749 family)